ncbi:MAG: hypothetical protein WAM60_16965, partial [Candidatus Promineifilaceae bacterium]
HPLFPNNRQKNLRTPYQQSKRNHLNICPTFADLPDRITFEPTFKLSPGQTRPKIKNPPPFSL